jgi:predicted negative regulator of RcsB-dependent stress response
LGTKKIKGTKKKFGKTEEILTIWERFKAWLEENPYMIAGAVIAVVLACAVVWGLESYGKAKEKSADSAYARIFSKWPVQENPTPKEWEALVPELETFVEKHRGTTAGMNAQLDLCQVYDELKKPEETLKWCEKVTKNSSAGPSLKSLARYQLALSLEAQGKSDEAIRQWDALKNNEPEWLGREANWHLARLYSQKKDYSKAVAEYEQALKASGSYPSSALLQEELAAAKLKAGSSKSQAKNNSPG